MSRACLAAIRLDFAAALSYHPLFWLLPFLLLFFVYRRRFSKRTRSVVLFLTVLLFMAVYIFRMYDTTDTIVVFHPQDGLIWQAAEYFLTLLSIV